ncbi:MAG: transcription termination/antitermination protein NusA, partial [Lachnospiraceae bacterium]|nr:transcription termination/antitermination protein NusA [Lachnospiraceae bacterium]
MDNSEFLAAVLQIEKEKNISRDEIFNAISEALLTACKQTYGNNDNIFVDIDHETGAYHLYTKKTVVK